MSKKIYVCVPMDGRMYEQIIAHQVKLYDRYTNWYPEIEYELIDDYFNLENDEDIIFNKELHYFAKTMRLLANADVVLFDTDYYKDKICNLEYHICTLFNINKRIIQIFDDNKKDKINKKE